MCQVMGLGFRFSKLKDVPGDVSGFSVSGLGFRLKARDVPGVQDAHAVGLGFRTKCPKP